MHFCVGDFYISTMRRQGSLVLQLCIHLFSLLDFFLPRCMECRRGLAMRFLSVCLSVRPSVCPSDKRVHCDITEEKSVQIFLPCERSFSVVF